MKLLVRHACWQKLYIVSASLKPGRDSAHIQDLVTELRGAGQLDVAVQILLDIGETQVSCPGMSDVQALQALIFPDEPMQRLQCCACT